MSDFLCTKGLTPSSDQASYRKFQLIWQLSCHKKVRRKRQTFYALKV